MNQLSIQLDWKDTMDSACNTQLEYTPREYQVELLQSALEENIIVYLPTGSGKTFIAALLIKEKSYEVTKPLGSGGKRTVFLVPTIVLAIQQAAYLKRHTHLKVKEFYGSMGVDMWGATKWTAEFEENHVLVMTAQVFVDILNHAFFSPHKLNLLVFDECHAAVKDAPMKQILSKLHNCDSFRRPKILGLTAALFRMRCKPYQVRGVIQKLSESMGCVVKSPSDIETVFSSSTKPCECVFQCGDDNTNNSSDASYLSTVILTMLRALVRLLRPLYGKGSDDNDDSLDFVLSKHEDKVDVLWDALKDMLYLLETFGPYGAAHCALVYTRILQAAKTRAKVPQFSLDLDKVLLLCRQIRDLCNPYFQKYSSKDRLLLFVKPRAIRLLDIIRKFSPEQIDQHSQSGSLKMCAIVFVERRSMANVLYHFLKEIRQYDTTLEFLKPLFIMGQAAGNASLKEAQVLNIKQKEIIERFREGTCNLLVATSVLEEGIDIPACNLIVRFDRIKTYCDYVQTKGRARSSKAFYCIIVKESETEQCLDDLAQFHGIEQQLTATDNFEDDRHNAIDDLFVQIIKPYTPFGEEGPRVTLQSSISLVHRYCNQLPSDVVLVPRWAIKELDEKEVDPTRLRVICDTLKKLPKSTTQNLAKSYKKPEENQISFFQCSVILPLNAPLREEIVGEVMPTKRLAKRSAALKTCVALHQLKELDDLHLLPVTKLKFIEDEEDLPTEEDRPNISAKTGVYQRRWPVCFTNCRPFTGQSTFVYSINLTLLKPGADETKFYFPFAVDTKLAILTTKPIPTISPFPLVTRAGEFQVHLSGVDSVILKEFQLEKLDKFHRFIFEKVLFVWKRQLIFDPKLAELQYLVVPLEFETDRIDFDFIEKMISAPEIDWEKPTHSGEHFHFDPELFSDAVVVPWYKPLGTLNAYYVDQISQLTPLSPFPNETHQTYGKYYLHKHGIKLTNLDQPLLQVSREISGKNFLVPRVLSANEEPIHLVPELCFVHPLPASIWKQVVWIPSILHRLHGMLVAEELRVTIVTEAKIGIDFLPSNLNVSDFWRPLQIQLRKSYRNENRSLPKPKPLVRSLKQLASADSSVDVTFMWNYDYGDSENGQNSSDSLTRLSHLTQAVSLKDTSTSDSSSTTPQNSSMEELPDSIEDQRRRWTELASLNQPEDKPSWNPEAYNVSFDETDLSTLYPFGPSPGLILEALTLAKAGEGFDMERLETIGDSILKTVISIYVYGETSRERCDEGRLTQLRTRQINNKHLFHLGIQKGIGESLVAQKFDLLANFLSSCFQTPPSSTEVNLHFQQFVSKKNIADSMEALIGVYLLTTGIKGAITVMNWMGLKTVPNIEDVKFNTANGFPVLTPTYGLCSNQSEEEEILHLYSGLDEFEKRLKYSFKNKALLIEALSHASYLPNRITSCYQRLEFLGDAVLDYLVTKFYYANPCQYSPAILTDLRSAVVNNQTFAVIAVKNQFHLYLKHLSLNLSLIIDRFVRTQEENGHTLMHEYFVLEATNTPKECIASNIDVPKVLGDIFESVAGAIFVDSGMSLDAVWKSYLPFLHESLEMFDKATPISPLRALHERHPGAVKFRKPESLPDGRLCVAIEVADIFVFKGVGGNSKTAKSAAAKYALNVLENRA